MTTGCWLRCLLNIPRNHRQWPCLLITRLLVTTTHPVLWPNIFISKHFRLSVLSGFPVASITQRSCRGLELDRGGAEQEHCSYSVLSEQAGLWSVRRGPGTSSDRRDGPQPGHSGVADSRSGKISHGRWLLVSLRCHAELHHKTSQNLREIGPSVHDDGA